jgi:RNA polymerase sigma-70 factor (sigma-E family)
MDSDAAVHPGRMARRRTQHGPQPPPGADTCVTALYQAHALGLIRFAYLMLGERQAAEDVVQEAFAGLYRRWEKLSDPGKALPYVRASVLNGCRSQLRRHGRATAGLAAAGLADAAFPVVSAESAVVSAESAVLSAEQRRSVLRALRQLPPRQREVLVLRFYLDLSEPQIAAAMGIGPSTVRSTAHRALRALGRMLEEPS